MYNLGCSFLQWRGRMVERVQAPEQANQAGEPRASRETRDVRHHRIYASVRLPTIRDEMKALQQERKELATSLKEGGGDDPKATARRRVYLTLRLEKLRNEQKELLAERHQPVGVTPGEKVPVE